MVGFISDFIAAHPYMSIIIFALLVSFFISLVNFFILDKEKLRNIKSRQKTIQEEMKQHKDNPEKMMALQKEMLSHTWTSMKHSFKPMLITTIPVIIFFSFMRNSFAATPLARTWIWYYLGISIIGTSIFRKVFKLP